VKNRTASQFSLGALGPLLDMETPKNWQDLAACQYTDPEVFFPVKGGTSAPAKRICAACAVRMECLEFALDNDERFGVFGGTSEAQRRRILRDRARSAQPGPQRMCRRNLHVMDAANTNESGKCRACGGQSAAQVPDNGTPCDRTEAAQVA
jgi:WhiB family redox-sensing transcriptional regulator